MVASSGAACGQVKLISPTDDTTDEIHVYRMTVSPAVEPRPALKYHLLTPAVDQINANAATFYYKSMVYDGPDLLGQMNSNAKGLEDAIDNWLEMPLNELPQDEINGRVAWLSDHTNWRPLLESAHCDHCDWGDLIQQEGAITLLPQAQKMRTTARGLCLKVRLETAQNKFGDAIETLRVGYALSRNLSRSTTLVQNLVGMAIEGILNEQTRTFIATKTPQICIGPSANLRRNRLICGPRCRTKCTFGNLPYTI